MEEELAHKAVNIALSAGCSYSEARIHRIQHMSYALNNGQPLPPSSVTYGGIGIRLVYNGVLGFAYTNMLEAGSVKSAVESAVKFARRLSGKTGLSKEIVTTAYWLTDEHKKFEDAGFDDLKERAEDYDSMVRQERLIGERSIHVSGQLTTAYYVNSENTIVRSRASRYSVTAILTAHSDGKTAQRFLQLGGSGGPEVLERLAVRDSIQEEVKSIPAIVKSTSSVEPGTYNVVVGPEISGIMAHESVGHPLEADRVIGREGAQGGESYVRPGSEKLKIGSEQMNVSDDPTIPYSYGYYMFDDEGVKARKKQLVVSGEVNELLHNRETASLYGVKSNAASRASSFDVEPIVRMSNTYVEPGDMTMEELIREAKNGIYMKSFMEWNIDDTRMNQRYVGYEAYQINQGELGQLLRGVILETNTPELWSRLAGRSRDLEFTAATCGKGDPEQGVPVWTGGPYMLFNGLYLRRR
ncbi:MAG: TldD/PmbA family protein [Nitrososphaeria archaeon]